MPVSTPTRERVWRCKRCPYVTVQPAGVSAVGHACPNPTRTYANGAQPLVPADEIGAAGSPHVGAYVEVVYQHAGTDDPPAAMRGYWSYENEQWPDDGPRLVMNPAVVREPSMCCWSVHPGDVLAITTIERSGSPAQ